MKHAVAATAFAAALQSIAVEGALTKRQAPTINTPSGLVTCEPTSITWTGGTSPFFLSIYPGGTVENPYEQFPSVSASPFQWTVNIAAGTNVTIGIRDGAGNTNSDSPLVITAGPDTSCVNVTGTGSSTGSGSSGGSSVSSSGGTSPSSASSGGSTGSSPTSSGSSPASTTGSSTGSGAGMVKAGASTLVLGALAAFSYLF